MSNPYDPYNNQGTPGDPPPPPPYGAPIGSQGGGGGAYPPSPYSQDSPYGDNAPKKTDAVSITGFVLSLTCCLSVVGAILGFIGLKRTKDNQRKGRWAAIAASIIGVLGTLAFIGGILFIVVFAKSVINVDEAKVGQCANISSQDNKSVLLTDTDCSGDHDAEITYVGKFSDVEGLDIAPTNPDDFTDAGSSLLICTALMDPADVTALGDSVGYQYVNQDGTPTSNDAVLCYAERTDGKKFTSKQLP